MFAAHRRISAISFFLVSCLVCSDPGMSQTFKETLWFPNGEVKTQMKSSDGKTLYIGGDFSYVGPYTGQGAFLDTTSQQAIITYPAIEGEVFAAVPDSSGGWFIGGSFRRVAGVPMYSIAHIKPDGSLDRNWNATLQGQQPDGSNYATITEMGLSGSTLYVSGGITNPRGVVALDANTGAFKGTLGDVSGVKIAVASNTVYVAGYFTRINGEQRNGLAAFDAKSFALKSWDPRSDGNTFFDLSTSGSRVFVSGLFSTIGGQIRHGVACLDSSTGSATAWDIQTTDDVRFIATSGSTVYVSSLNGFSFTLAAFDDVTGKITKWRVSPNEQVNSLAVRGSMVYIAGRFTSIDGQKRTWLAALDTATGSPTSWSLPVSSHVNCIVSSGPKIFFGGRFSSIGGRNRNCLAAIDIASGIPSDWDPAPDGYVNALVVSGSSLYVGGNFSNIGRSPRAHLAAVDASTGDAIEWNPDPDNIVETIGVSGATLFAGGWFSNIGGKARKNLAAVDISSGAATNWNPGSNSPVRGLTISGATVYVYGFLNANNRIGGQTRNNLAAIDASTGLATKWAPEPDYTVNSLLLSGSTIYVGGSFSFAGGKPRSLVAALDSATGLATDWNPIVRGELGTPGVGYVDAVYALAAAGPTLYVAGHFAAINNQDRSRIASFDLKTGSLTNWNPNTAAYPNGTPGAGILSISLSGKIVFVGGAYDYICGRSDWQNLAGLGDASIVSALGSSNNLLPSLHRLSQNYPNPFNPSTAIRYQLSALSAVTLKVMDVLGREVATLVNEQKPAGTYTIQWNASKLPSGMYFYRLIAQPVGSKEGAPFVETRKMILTR